MCVNDKCGAGAWCAATKIMPVFLFLWPLPSMSTARSASPSEGMRPFSVKVKLCVARCARMFVVVENPIPLRDERSHVPNIVYVEEELLGASGVDCDDSRVMAVDEVLHAHAIDSKYLLVWPAREEGREKDARGPAPRSAAGEQMVRGRLCPRRQS